MTSANPHRADLCDADCSVHPVRGNRTCPHPVEARRALGFDKEWKQTGTYCQQCGNVLERFKER